jgi:hypothetical protein
MKKKETAAELMARLSADPDWVARKHVRDEERRLKERESADAETSLVGALRDAGAEIDSVWDIVNKKMPRELHERLLPILLARAERPYPASILDGIARALVTPAAKWAWPSLVRLYLRQPTGRAKDGFAVALANVTDDETLHDLISLARDPANGPSRILLLEALGRSADPVARKALMEFGADDILRKESQRLLRKMARRRR